MQKTYDYEINALSARQPEFCDTRTRTGKHHRFDPESLGVKPENWDEDRTPWRPLLVLRAETYHPDRLFDLTPCQQEFMTQNYKLSPSGSFAYQNRIVPKGMPLQLLGREEGYVLWTEDVVIPTLVDTSRYSRNGEPFSPDIPEAERVASGAVWMSLTPMEMITQRSGVQAAKGVVVLGGLGLGWLLRKVCEKDSVERVIVVDNSKELLDWYGNDLCRKYQKVSEVICDDVYNQIGNHWGARYLLDIWHTLSGATQDERLIEAKKRFRDRLWAWGWQERHPGRPIGGLSSSWATSIRTMVVAQHFGVPCPCDCPGLSGTGSGVSKN